jgi:hypothetical protein
LFIDNPVVRAPSIYFNKSKNSLFIPSVDYKIVFLFSAPVKFISLKYESIDFPFIVTSKSLSKIPNSEYFLGLIVIIEFPI